MVDDGYGMIEASIFTAISFREHEEYKTVISGAFVLTANSDTGARGTGARTLLVGHPKERLHLDWHQ